MFIKMDNSKTRQHCGNDGGGGRWMWKRVWGDK